MLTLATLRTLPRRLSRLSGRVLALGGLALLAACATPAEPGRMTLTPAQDAKPFAPQLATAMCVRDVTGGSTTNPLWVSQVGNDEFKEALQSTLRNYGVLADANPCRYPIDVNLLGLSQPIMGFDAEVTSHVNYKVMNPANEPLLLETISASYTANFSEHPIGVVRLKRANEGSIRENITKFLQRLRETPPKA
ncbi:hypothetical protein [Limobrevibacterium gyesilva]|uniref:DUF4136 domain-containing protein n=1 Tax=Limobrevibacterium gyesilva TaxID=2991712 RepID=A0AA42CFM9_9PROT|nr:hypothetical protein [Limobrevibacterium gyesilva]MCW3475081.1 hypothetical protein [Limobrevibacterium gyesilva]